MLAIFFHIKENWILSQNKKRKKYWNLVWLWNSLCDNPIYSPSARGGFICHCLMRIFKEGFPEEWAEVILSAAKYIDYHKSRAGLVLGTCHANISFINHWHEGIGCKLPLISAHAKPALTKSLKMIGKFVLPKGVHYSAPLVSWMKRFYVSLPCLWNRYVATPAFARCGGWWALKSHQIAS